MTRYRRWIGALTLLLCAAGAAGAQQNGPVVIVKPNVLYPYTFGNFVWWSDADLRAELHRRLPRLGETIAPASPEERAVHDALVAMLRKKHISADVQSIEPPLLTSGPRSPDAPPPSIEFSVLEPPRILVGSVEAPTDISSAAGRLAGKPYDRGRFWTTVAEIERPFKDRGYLAAEAHIEPGAPVHQGKDWTVPVTVTVDQGPQFRVGTVKVDGGPLLEGRNLQRFVAVHPGEVARGSAYGMLAAAVGEYYRRHGFVDVQVEGGPELDREHNLANYTFRTEPGQEYHVRSITIEGLGPAASGEVREMLGLAEGDVFDTSKLSGVSTEMKSSPAMLGERYSYSYVKDREHAMVDLRLEFGKAADAVPTEKKNASR